MITSDYLIKQQYFIYCYILGLVFNFLKTWKHVCF